MGIVRLSEWGQIQNRGGLPATYSDFNGILVTDQTDIGCPRIAGDDCSDEHKPFVVGRVGSGDMSAIRRPAERRIGAKSINFVTQNFAYLNLRKNVLPGESSNGFVTTASSDQSVVLQIFTDLSSD